MTKEQAGALLDGLRRLEMLHPGMREKYGSFNNCIFTFRGHLAESPTIKPLKGFEKEVALWQEVIKLFTDVIAGNGKPGK